MAILGYNQRTLKAVWNNWDNGKGVFSFMRHFGLSFLPLDDASIAAQWDFDYYAFNSGRKQSQGAILQMVDDEGHLPDVYREKVARSIVLRYRHKWEALLNAFKMAEANPFTTYSSTESVTILGNETESATKSALSTETSQGVSDMTTDAIGTRSASQTATDKSNDTTSSATNTTDALALDGSELRTRVGATKDDAANGVYGFNSDASTKSTASDATGASVETDSTSFQGRTDTRTVSGGTTETTLHGADSESAILESNSDTRTNVTSSDNVRSMTGSDNETREWTKGGTESRMRTGFSGRTQAELFTDFLDLWKEDFEEIVFKDVDEYLSLSVY